MLYYFISRLIKPAGCNLFFANQRYEVSRKKCCPLKREKIKKFNNNVFISEIYT